MPVLSVALEVIIMLCALLSVTKSGAQIDFHIISMMLEIRIAMQMIFSLVLQSKILRPPFSSRMKRCHV